MYLTNDYVAYFNKVGPSYSQKAVACCMLHVFGVFDIIESVGCTYFFMATVMLLAQVPYKVCTLYCSRVG